MKDENVLIWADWGERHFGSVTTSRFLPLRDVRRCVERGLLKSVGLVTLCDDDGFTLDPERFREGYVLTEAGRAALPQDASR